jgi:hypothetical protein
MWNKFIVSLLWIAFGTVMIYGANQRWRWLVDPKINDRRSFLYSQALIKRIFGKEALLSQTYFMGAIILFVGFMLFISFLLDLFPNWYTIHP